MLNHLTMKHRFHILAVTAAVFISTAAWGNGDPVIEYSAVRRSANPVPMTISEIRVAAERLRIIPGLTSSATGMSGHTTATVSTTPPQNL